MKCFLLLLINCCIGIALHAQQAPVFSYSETGSVITNKSFINPLWKGDFTNLTPYIVKKEIQITSLTGWEYGVKLSKYNGWENEPEDFDVIEIEAGGNQILCLSNDNGWDYFYTTDNYIKDADNPIKAINLSTDCIAVVLTGITIMSQPPLITIIILKNEESKLVYNRPAEITAIKVQNGETIFDLQLNTVEYDGNGNPYNAPELATLTFKNGMIYYEEK